MKAKLPVLYIFIALFFGVVCKAFSQEKVPHRILVLKFSPLVMFEPIGGYQLGAEIPMKQNFSLQAEFAHLPYYWDIDFGELEFFSRREDYNAWAFKTEARFYFTDAEANGILSSAYVPDMQGFYMASQLQVKRITESDSSYDWNFAGEERYVKYTLTTTIVKINAKAGYQKIFDNGFVFDCYTGFGFRAAETDIDRTNVTYYVPYSDIPVNFALGAKIGWAF